MLFSLEEFSRRLATWTSEYGDTFQKGDWVRLDQDPSRWGYLTGREKSKMGGRRLFLSVQMLSVPLV